MITLLPRLQFAPRDLECPLTTPVPPHKGPIQHTRGSVGRAQASGGSQVPQQRGSFGSWFVEFGVHFLPLTLPLLEETAQWACVQGWQGVCSGSDKWRTCTS